MSQIQVIAYTVSEGGMWSKLSNPIAVVRIVGMTYLVDQIKYAEKVRNVAAMLFSDGNIWDCVVGRFRTADMAALIQAGVLPMNEKEIAQDVKPKDVEPSSVNSTLHERGSRYGKFTAHAAITQGIKSVMYKTPNWEKLSSDQKEALEMIAHKIGRILNGDPNYADSWHDIAGYAELVDKRLSGVSL